MEKQVTEEKFKFPTETVDLPSKGLIYPKDNPLSSGKIEMKYMTAKEEDILTNTNLIQSGKVIDKLLESLIISDIKIDDLILGDKNALLVAIRVLGYGKDYTFKSYNTNTNEPEDVTVDLTTIKDKNLDPKNLKEEGLNEFDFILPTSNVPITFKLLTHKDEISIAKEIEGLKKLKKDIIPESTTRFKYTITSIDGDREKKTIRDFVDNYFLAKDAQPLRKHIKEISPDIDLVYEVGGEEVSIPIGVNFFWPDSRI